MRFLLAVALGMAIVLAVLSGGASDSAATVAAERTAQVQAQEAARAAIAQAQEAERTERTAIMEAQRTERAADREATFRLALLLLVVVVVVIGGATVLIAWLRRPVPSVPLSPRVLRIASQMPYASLEYDPDANEWVLVEEDGRYLTITDAARLLERS